MMEQLLSEKAVIGKYSIKKKPKILVLIDSRTGGANQALELAQQLGELYDVEQVQYNLFAKLPNYLLSFFPIHVKRSILKRLRHKKIPEIIISSGRRTAALAIYLKKISKNVKIIQIMRPYLDYKEFEFIILPQHDSFPKETDNVIRVVGALSHAKSNYLKTGSDFNNYYPDMTRFIAVIIGGSTKNQKMTLEDIKPMADALFTISENHALPLFISFSRRTPRNVKDYFYKKFTWPHNIYDTESNRPNPYPAILYNADYIVCTMDSISMCSEAASTGKPLYIFNPPNFKLKKHKIFVQYLVDFGKAKFFDIKANYLKKYKYSPLDEMGKVVNIIKKRLLK